MISRYVHDLGQADIIVFHAGCVDHSVDHLLDLGQALHPVLLRVTPLQRDLQLSHCLLVIGMLQLLILLLLVEIDQMVDSPNVVVRI